MIYNLKLVVVDSKYCDYLRKYDYRVPYNMNKKGTRPFVGVLFKIEDCEYFSPLSSPKLKHKKMKNMLDFFKIKDGDLGAINFNNMIPIKSNNYEVIDLNKPVKSSDEKKYQSLLLEQLSWLNAHKEQIYKKSYKVYNLYISKRLPKIVFDRCCNYPLLEEKCIEYNIINK